MYTTKKYPQCGSCDLTMERRIDGNTICNNCNYSAKHSEFDINKKDEVVTHISHYEIRKHLSMWSRASRQLVR